MTYAVYPSDLSDKEWDLIKGYFSRKDPRGCKPQHDKRTIVNAIFYLNKSGIQWRMLPKNFPPWKTVYDYFRLWSRAGLWEQILDSLNIKYRQQEGRKPMPTYSILDTQTAKTHFHGEERGFDGGKKDTRTQAPYWR